MIEINNLCHSFDDKKVLSNISLSIPDNCILGIVGINGAGKSTFLRLLAGVYDANSGDILFDGASPKEPSTRAEMFFLPDDPYYTTYTTPRSLLNFYKTFYPSVDKELFHELLAKYSIAPNGYMRNFSKGMRRQTFIALALSIKPKYLLLDEAFDGLDPLSRKIFKDHIIDFVEKNAGTVLISSHSLRELEDFCDKFILIDENRIKSQGDISAHVGKLCKFELAFTKSPSEEMFEGFPTKALEIRGKFVTAVFTADSEEILPKLIELSPAVIEEMTLDFEEAFIYDVEKKGDGTHEK